ncbi:putative ferric aerobactin receptor [Prevotella intermedia]|uniref:Ferric aerobactin receptor n=1 Tax=Prevotella intermedia TaxID=28131 RepID=A0A1P8JN63_PREIN|nr:carboxypeptidase-like regulatory domain-containing protein [Prevotella intermedia]AFJ07471.1 TonB-dependent receptor plug domain protein [Prevotella intermedia 17]APW35192.1 TonB-dependent receptor [Prevotella intermedia]MCK6144322.1 TonB-dependent receptor [Prevotella intermedia]OWP31916.1 TonB-dependent receptor [Prevotella intermedia]PDP67957.1 TonB-dependent receptor [Prevotella intermedia]
MNKAKLLNIILLFLCLLYAGNAMGQSFTLQGKVSDQDGNPIELASIMVASQGKITMSNLKGEFSMQLQSEDSVKVRFSMLGYKSKVRVLRRPQGKQTLQIQLSSDNEMQEVVVQAKVQQHGTTEEIKVEATKRNPSVSGNVVEEILQTQAGVSTHSELSSQYNVRGGTFDENSVYINNVEVYRPFLVRSGQQEGLSVINADLVESVGFSTGGFEAKYGDKMSSALDITYKRPKRTEGSITASMLGANGYLGIATKKLTWTNGLRYKTNKYLLGSLETKGEYNPSFLDYQTYLSWQPSKRWQVDFIGNISENNYNFEPKDRETKFGTLKNVKSFKVYFDGKEKDLFRTFFGSLSITNHLTPRTDISLIASAFSTKEQQRYDIQGQYWLTQTETSENLGVGTYMQHSRDYLKANVRSLKLMMQQRAGNHRVEGALTYKIEKIEENSAEYEYRDSAGYNIPHTGETLNMIYSMRARNNLDAKRIEAYLQDTWNFKSNDSVPTLYRLNYGVRYAHWDFNGESIVSPRASLNITPGWNRNLSFRVAAGLYYQAPFYKELRDTTMINGVTYALLNKKIRSQRSIHALASMSYRFSMMNRPFKFTAEAYYKAISRLVPYSVDNVKVTYYGDNETSGHAAGLDLKLFGEFVPGADSWLTLSVMNTSMKLNGKNVPLPTDQRFALNLFFTDYFPGSTRWRMSLKLAYADGLPFSAPHQELTSTPFRAPAYKRADIGMSYRLFDNQDGSRSSIFRNVWLGLDCLNLFGINNVNSYYWITDISGQQYAVPNYLTGRQINAKISVEF